MDFIPKYTQRHILDSVNGLVVRALEFQYCGPGFKTTELLKFHSDFHTY